MKEIRTLSITHTENEVLTKLADFCYDKPSCKGCPLKEVCDKYLKRTGTDFEIIGDFLTNILIKVKIEEED